MSALPASHDPALVACALLIASLTCHVALDVSRRVRAADQRLCGWWLAGGGLATGTGLWAANFTALLSLRLDVPLGFAIGATAQSWLAAVAASAIALYAASFEKLSWPRLWTGALAGGAALAAAHYLGLHALEVAPGIRWDWQAVIGSVVGAIAASATLMEAFFQTRKGQRRQGFDVACALALGGAFGALHALGTRAAGFSEDTFCLSEDALSANNLGTVLVGGALGLLIFTRSMGHLETRLRARSHALSVRLRKADERLRQRSLRDALTGLPTRALFDKLLSKALKRLAAGVAEGRDGAKVAVLFIDLDGFKPVNDAQGHAVGDLVLKEVATRLRKSARAGDVVARIGGDEFVMLMECETALVDPAISARRIVQAVGATIDVGGRGVRLSCSVGIALYPEHGPRERLVAHADAAMGAAKRRGGNAWAQYEERLEVAPDAPPDLHALLRQAIANGELALQVRPRLDERSGEVRGIDAQLQWNHPVHGVVGPPVSVPVAGMRAAPLTTD